MKLLIWKTNEGPTAAEYKAGDIMGAYPDTWNPGTDETKKWFVVQMPDYLGNLSELTRSKYTLGPLPGEIAYEYMALYHLDLSKMKPQDAAKYLDPTKPAPVCTGIYTLDDILQK